MEKMTNVKALAYVLAKCELTDEVREKVEKMKAQFEKKNSAEKKPTEKQIANQGIQEAILEGMVEGQDYTITDLIKSVPACADLTNQRVSALVRQMLGISIERVEVKGKAYFHKIA